MREKLSFYFFKRFRRTDDGSDGVLVRALEDLKPEVQGVALAVDQDHVARDVRQMVNPCKNKRQRHSNP